MNDNTLDAEVENGVIFDLVDSYKNKYKDLHHKNTTERFEQLVGKSRINVYQNRETNKKISETDARIKDLDRRIKKRNTIKTLIIVLIVVSVLVILGQVVAMSKVGLELAPLLIACLGGGSIVLCVYLLMKLNRTSKTLKIEKYELESSLQMLTAEAWEHLRPLNELLNPKICPELFAKTLPAIRLDKIFDAGRLDFLTGRFGFEAPRDNNRSTLYVQSGDINGNPFFISLDLVHELGTKTYTGSRTIHWTTTHFSGGKTVTHHHTQTLTATIEKPCPYYKRQAYLVYGNEAAPELIFSRQDSDAEHMDQKQIDKQVSKEIKKLHKKAEKETARGGGFTVMGNSEFEVLFGATDRNNEVEFRLLFTPLAQKQLLDLMKDKEAGFGDDFAFVKRRMINYLYPQHLKDIKLNITPGYFQGYDYDEVKKRFISYNNDYFRYIYFALAPILVIPLYQQQRPGGYASPDSYESYASFYEHEQIANSLPEHMLCHPESSTPSILKTTVIGSGDNRDTVRVTAYGYRSERRVDYVQKLGGDGRIHSIPVEWTEYIPVTQETEITVSVVPDEDVETTYAEKFRQAIERLTNRDNIGEKEIFKAGIFLAYILKKQSNTN